MYSLSPSKEETYVEFKRGLMNLKAIKTNNQRRRELKLKQHQACGTVVRRMTTTV